jgi:ABC-type antimicrobial peptide transport system permease subunit
MSAVWMRLRSDLRNGRRSVLALALLIAIAGAATLGPLAGARRTDSAYDRFIADSNSHDVETNEGVPGLGYNYELDLEAVTAFPEVAEYEINRVFIIALKTDDVEFPPGGEAVMVRGIKTSGPGVSSSRLVSGRLPRPDRVDEVAVGYGRSVADGITVGDRITLSLLSSSVLTQGLAGVTVAAEAQVTVVGVVLLPGAVPPAIRYGQIFATPAFERRYMEGTANARGLLVKLRRGPADIASFKTRLETLAGGAVQFLTSNDQDAGVKRSIDVYVVALQAFAGLAVAAALLILTQLLARQLTFGADDHPALRSLGMTPRQIALGGIMRSSVSALAGVAGAVVLAFLVSPIFPVGTARVVEPDPGFAFDALVLGGGAAGLIVLITAFAVPAAWQAGRRAVRDQRAAQPAGQERPSRAAALMSGSGAPASVVAGVRLALERGRGRSATPVRSTIVALAAAVASIVTLVSFGTSMANLVDTPRLYGWNWDSLAGNPYAPDLGAQVNPALAQLEDIQEYSSGSTNIRVQASRGDGRPLDLQALALTPQKGEVLPPLLEGRWPNDDDEVALGSGSMRALSVALGDTITIAVAGQEIRSTVVGRSVFPVVGDQYGGELGHGVGFTLDGLRRLVPDALENIFPVRFRPGVTFEDLTAEAKGLFFFESVEDQASIVLGSKPNDLENLSRVTGAPLALVSLVGLLGVTTIAHALITSVRRRRRDLAILKSMGFVKGQIRAAVTTQATTLALLALAIGIPLGLIIGRTAWLAFAEGQGVVPVAVLVSWPTFALIPATLLLANLVAALPGRAAANLAPAIVLRTE